MNRVLCAILSLLIMASCTESGIDEPTYTNPYDDTETDDDDQNSSTTEYLAINQVVDARLEYYYFWNDEYKTLERNLEQGYSEFMENTLLSMETNTLDKKKNSTYGQYFLYSYILQTGTTTSASTTRSSTKTKSTSYGFVDFALASLGTSYALTIDGVYGSSPASEGGIARGDMVILINGAAITYYDANSFYYSLLYPTLGESTSLTLYNITTGRQRTVSITAESIYTSPIILTDIFEVDGKKIGYLNYTNFESGYDDELCQVLDEFKTAGIDDLILDLRLNNGGDVSSSNLLSTAIAGSSGTDKVFTYYECNPSRMLSPEKVAISLGCDCENGDLFSKFGENNSGASYDMSLKRLYCLIGSTTASASEMLINSLRGIDFEVTLIGSTSEGKNVGMEVTTASAGGYSYTIAPITFRAYNAKWLGDYENGFTPEYYLNEYDSFSDYGQNEYLTSKAISLITGSTSAQATRSSESPILESSTMHRSLSGAYVYVNQN
ncbi:MAG: S41 family peptidase [Rikenellaceae bacterium]